MLKIEILGGGCASCDALTKETEKAISELELQATIEKVSDYEKISAYGVMTTPALVVNGDVKFSGRVLPAVKIKEYLI